MLDCGTMIVNACALEIERRPAREALLGKAEDGRLAHGAETPEAGPEGQMAKARDKVRVCAHARIVGVVFCGRPHIVIGRAPNAIELHPSLGFDCLD
jgi:hypothetical protein